MNTLVSNLLYPFLISVVVFYVFGKSTELKSRKEMSKLGVVIISSLIEEVKNGLKSMTEYIQFDFNKEWKQLILPVLPTKSWDGNSTIPKF